MPLLKGTFRPATKVARSRTNSTSDGERSRSNSISDLDASKPVSIGSKTISNSLVTSQFCAFKVPPSPIVVGLPPSKPTSGLFHGSPRKTPTTPFSPVRTLLSPHYIEPPILENDSEVEEDASDYASEDHMIEQRTLSLIHVSDMSELPSIDSDHYIEDSKLLYKKEDPFEEDWDTKYIDAGEDQAPAPSQTETVTTEIIEETPEETREETPEETREETPDEASWSDCNESDTMSVASYQGSESSINRKIKAPIIIDKSTMSMCDIIKMKDTRDDPDNPLTEVWRDLKKKEERNAEIDLKKEQSKKDRIQQLIEEAEAMGQTLDVKDIDESELPPIEVEVNPETGAIVVNVKSLEVKLNSETDIRETVIEDDAEVTFGKYEDHKVNSYSFSRRKPRKTTLWSPAETDRFYLALRKVGTDFDLMNKIMPEYTRDQLKKKFKREEKTRLSKIDLALSYSMRLDDNIIEKPPEPPKKPTIKKQPKKRLLKNEMINQNIKQETIKPDKKVPTKRIRDLCHVDMERIARRRVADPEGKAKTARSMLSPADDDSYFSRSPGKRQSRPLVIDDEAFEHAAMRDTSLDRKVVL